MGSKTSPVASSITEVISSCVAGPAVMVIGLVTVASPLADTARVVLPTAVGAAADNVAAPAVVVTVVPAAAADLQRDVDGRRDLVAVGVADATPTETVEPAAAWEGALVIEARRGLRG